MSDKSNKGGADDTAVVDEARLSRVRIERARLARVFGDVLPETTEDERDSSSAGVSVDWMREQRPPHYQ